MRLSLAVAISCFTAIAYAINDKELTGDEKHGTDEPRYWQAILGDICQLPGFPRATGDPQRYVECVKQNLDSGDRKDLGIWLLRECLPGYEFVASARRCKTTRSILRQQQLCDGPTANNYQFCPDERNAEFTIQEIRQAPRQCTCPNGENNCVCPTPEILEPVMVPRNSKLVRRSPQSTQNLPNCPCPPSNTNCVCLNVSVDLNGAMTQTPQVYRDSCCQQQQQPPCMCNDQPQPQQNQNCQTTTTQQQYCPQPQQNQNQQPSIVQPQSCPLVQGGVQNARYQGICSWMVDPLATDPESRTHFLQCQPAPNNLFCGRWQRMPCAPATVFDANAQVCVWDSQNGQPGNLPTPAPYVATQPQRDSQCSCTGGANPFAKSDNHLQLNHKETKVPTKIARPSIFKVVKALLVWFAAITHNENRFKLYFFTQMGQIHGSIVKQRTFPDPSVYSMTKSLFHNYYCQTDK
uniref:Chitin-binding type-2 domain-containing protein n=1 Tax=Panagrolaimus sp. JU765 TaxID=591449 RepID=A0AC34Q1Q8_9BILA